MNVMLNRTILWTICRQPTKCITSVVRQKSYSALLRQPFKLPALVENRVLGDVRLLKSSTVSSADNFSLETPCDRTMLSESLTNDQKEKLVRINKQGESEGNVEITLSTRKQFKLKAILEEISIWENDGFPLPESLEEQHWEDLIRIENREIRLYYLDALANGNLDEEKKEKLFETDQVNSGPLVLPQQMLDEIMARGDPEELVRLDEIKNAFELLWQRGEGVYPIVGELEFRAMMEENNRKRITDTFRYITTKHNSELSDFRKKRIRGVNAVERKRNLDEKNKNNKHIIYGLGHNTIFHRILDSGMEWPDNNKVIREFNEWGQPLVIDLAFLKNMTFQELKSLCYRELPFGLRYNKESREPFAIYFVNYDPNCEKCAVLKLAIQKLMNDDYPAIVTEKSYTDLFPPERLVYMSPNSRNDIWNNDADNVYILGAIVDCRSGRQPLTISTAKKQNIRHARFPMKRVVGIDRELNIDSCMGIMADFKSSSDWFYALRWIPPRLFRNRLKNGGYTAEMEAVYKVHKKLSPHIEKDGSNYVNVPMLPGEYRRQYKKLMQDFLEADRKQKQVTVKDIFSDKPISKNVADDIDKYKWKGKEAYFKKKYGFLN